MKSFKSFKSWFGDLKCQCSREAERYIANNANDTNGQNVGSPPLSYPTLRAELRSAHPLREVRFHTM